MLYLPHGRLGNTRELSQAALAQTLVYPQLLQLVHVDLVWGVAGGARALEQGRQPLEARLGQEGGAAAGAELDTWTERVGGPQLPPATLLRGVTFWSRLHGLISLELDRHLVSMHLDPELLYRAELAELGAET